MTYIQYIPQSCRKKKIIYQPHSNNTHHLYNTEAVVRRSKCVGGVTINMQAVWVLYLRNCLTSASLSKKHWGYNASAATCTTASLRGRPTRHHCGIGGGLNTALASFASDHLPISPAILNRTKNYRILLEIRQMSAEGNICSAFVSFLSVVFLLTYYPIKFDIFYFVVLS